MCIQKLNSSFLLSSDLQYDFRTKSIELQCCQASIQFDRHFNTHWFTAVSVCLLDISKASALFLHKNSEEKYTNKIPFNVIIIDIVNSMLLYDMYAGASTPCKPWSKCSMKNLGGNDFYKSWGEDRKYVLFGLFLFTKCYTQN